MAVEPDAYSWERFAHPTFRVAFSYPIVTPGGYRVERTEERVEAHPVAGDFERVHLSSPDGELYVEVARFPRRSPHDAYAQHHPYLAQRFGERAVSELSETSFADQRAWTYGFRWDGGERSVLLLEVGGDTYRVIYDPRSELNARVLATLTVSD